MAAPEAAITVHLRVSPTLRHRLSAFAGTTVVEMRLAPGALVRDLAAAVGVDLDAEPLLCLVNSRVEQPDSVLHDGDQVRLMHRIAGGS